MHDHATVLEILDKLIIDECAEPSFLTFSVLQEITDNFSEHRQIGRGGFSTVYKATGVLPNGFVAVKKLLNSIHIDEQKYKKEVEYQAKIKHKNIVRYLGYYSATEHILSECEGKCVMADLRHHLICFEYLPKGSLDKYITDESSGLTWKMSYEIINGICQGLHYLHEKQIVHLDLKPANILQDHNMVPKIADFGVARCFDENQTRVITKNIIGSIGYLPPEYLNKKEISLKSDIYSLGVVIKEMLIGKKEFSTVNDVKTLGAWWKAGHRPFELVRAWGWRNAHMRQLSITNLEVLESWRSRLMESLSADTALEEIRACAEISIDCMNSDPRQRPVIDDIIAKLTGKMKITDTSRRDNQSYMLGAQTGLVPGGLLDVQPLQLQFRDQVSKFVPCPVYLTNKTDHHVAFRLVPKDEQISCCLRRALYGVVPPSSECKINLKIQDVGKASDTKEELLILQTSIIGTFIDFKQLSRPVLEMTLRALYVLKRSIMKIVLKVAITCKKCKDTVLRVVSRIKGIKSLSFDDETSLVTVMGDMDAVMVVKALRKAKYPAMVVSVTNTEEDVEENNDQEINQEDGGGDQGDIAGPNKEEDVQEESDRESYDDSEEDQRDVAAGRSYGCCLT